MDKELNTSLGRVSGLCATSGTSAKPKEDCERKEKRGKVVYKSFKVQENMRLALSQELRSKIGFLEKEHKKSGNLNIFKGLTALQGKF